MTRGFALASLLFTIAVILIACGPGQVFEDASERATREYNSTAYVGTVAAIGTQEATIAALQATADYAVIMATQIGQLTFQNRALQATLTSMGGARPSAGGLGPGDTAQLTPIGVPTRNVPGADNSGVELVTTYRNLTTATGVFFENGCAVDSMSSFRPNQGSIYVVVVGSNVQQGIRYTVHWFREGVEQPNNDFWTADQYYEEICIWFFTEGPFEAGNWSVEFDADGEAIGTTNFVISN